MTDQSAVQQPIQRISHKKFDISFPVLPRSSIASVDLEMSIQDDEEREKMNAAAAAHNNTGTDDEQYKGPKQWRYLVDKWPIFSQPLALVIIFLLLWAVGLSVLPAYTGPGSVLMRMAFLFIGAQVCGIVVSFCNLPDMLGMLFFGVLYKNIGLGNFDGFGGAEAILRELALVNIMLLAGLGLDLEMLTKLFGTVMRLTLIPTIGETFGVALLSHFLLKLPWLWAILLGLVVTAISPNVVVTVLLRLREERLGLNKGIHTIILAVTSCNDVLSIFFFGVFLSVIFSTGNLRDQLLQGPIGVGVGFVFGVALGVALLCFPSKKSTYSNGLRFAMIILGGTVSVVGSKAIGYPSAGALGCITMAMVAGGGWRKSSEAQKNDIVTRLDLLWKFLKPVSFALIGKEVDFSVLEGNIVVYGAITLLIGVLIRLATSYLSLLGGELNWKERAYVTIAGMPKATVQAALGPIALDLARSLNSKDEIVLANMILVVTVLAIIFTAPLGAVLMTKLAPSWLKRSPSISVT